MTGEELYAIYGTVTDFKNYQGNPMPEWKDLPANIQLAWNTCGEAQNARLDLNERELRQVHFAHLYASKYQDAGVPGHSLLLVIAKLAEALDLV